MLGAGCRVQLLKRRLQAHNSFLMKENCLALGIPESKAGHPCEVFQHDGYKTKPDVLIIMTQTLTMRSSP